MVYVKKMTMSGNMIRRSLISGSYRNSAFTLVELLVVIVIVALLMGLLIPVLKSARASARKVACVSNLGQIGKAIHLYSMDFDDSIPVGPIAPSFLSPADFYPSTGAPTSLVSLRNGSPVGLGLLLQDYLFQQPEVLFCPDPDQYLSVDDELANVGICQAQSSYYYRHASVTKLFDDPAVPPPRRVALTDLGRNRNGRLIRALAIDTQFLCPSTLSEFNVKPRTHHGEKFANILFSSGRVVSCSNEDGRFTVDLRDYSELRNAFNKILEVLERGDEEH